MLEPVDELEVLVVSQGAVGAERLLAEEEVEVVADDMLTVPPPSSTAATPALLLLTVMVELLEPELEPEVELYQEFRTDWSIEPMDAAPNPNPRQDPARAAFTIA